MSLAFSAPQLCSLHASSRAQQLSSSAVICPTRPSVAAFSSVGSRPRPGRYSCKVTAQATEAPEAPLVFNSKPAPSYTVETDKYAVIDVGGTQHLVEEGRWYTCNRLKAEAGSKIQFGRVLAFKADGKFHVGRPYLDYVIVEAEILEDLKGPKITVFKHKPKKHYKKTQGHRQPLTKFMITKIMATADAPTTVTPMPAKQVSHS